MDATLKATLSGASATTFTAVSIALPAGTVRLLSGGSVAIGGNVYADDATYGALDMVETVEDGLDGQTSRATIQILPASSTAITNISAAAAQGSVVLIYQGAINTATGASIGTVETLFEGELDTAKLSVGAGGWVLTLECGTAEGRLLEPNDERRLSDAFHQSIWPGELGLREVTGVVRKIYWRARDPGSSAITFMGVSARPGVNPQ